MPEVIRREYGDFTQGQILGILHDIFETEAGVSFEYDKLASWRMHPEIFGTDIMFPYLALDIEDRENTSGFNINEAHIVLDGEMTLEVVAASPGVIVPYSPYDEMFLDALRIAYPRHPHHRCNRELARAAFQSKPPKPSSTNAQEEEPARPDREEESLKINDKRRVSLPNHLSV